MINNEIITYESSSLRQVSFTKIVVNCVKNFCNKENIMNIINTPKEIVLNPHFINWFLFLKSLSNLSRIDFSVKALSSFCKQKKKPGKSVGALLLPEGTKMICCWWGEEGTFVPGTYAGVIVYVSNAIPLAIWS